MSADSPDPLWLRRAHRPSRAVVGTGVSALLVILSSLALNGTAAVGWHAATAQRRCLPSRSGCSPSMRPRSPVTRHPAPGRRRRAIGLAFATAQGGHGAAVRRLGGARWHLLHSLGQVFVFGAYLVTYGRRVAENLSFRPGLSILLAAGMLQAGAALQSLRLRNRMLPTE